MEELVNFALGLNANTVAPVDAVCLSVWKAWQKSGRFGLAWDQPTVEHVVTQVLSKHQGWQPPLWMRNNGSVPSPFHYALLYGSAPAWVAGKWPLAPRDVNVAYGEISEADAVALASQWAMQNGLGHLPIKTIEYEAKIVAREGQHRNICYGFHSAEIPAELKSFKPEINIPVVRGIEPIFTPIYGEVEVKVNYMRCIVSSFLRLAIHDPVQAAAEFFRAASVGGEGLTFTIDQGWKDLWGIGTPEELRELLPLVPEDFFDRCGELGKFLRGIRNLGDRWPSIVPRSVKDATFDTQGGTYDSLVWFSWRTADEISEKQKDSKRRFGIDPMIGWVGFGNGAKSLPELFRWMTGEELKT